MSKPRSPTQLWIYRTMMYEPRSRTKIEKWGGSENWRKNNNTRHSYSSEAQAVGSIISSSDSFNFSASITSSFPCCLALNYKIRPIKVFCLREKMGNMKIVHRLAKIMFHTWLELALHIVYYDTMGASLTRPFSRVCGRVNKNFKFPIQHPT